MGQPAYLRGHELWRAAEGVCGVLEPHVLFAKTIVGKFDVTVEREHDVVKFQISSNEDVLLVSLRREHTESLRNRPVDDTLRVEIF